MSTRVGETLMRMSVLWSLNSVISGIRLRTLLSLVPQGSCIRTYTALVQKLARVLGRLDLRRYWETKMPDDALVKRQSTPRPERANRSGKRRFPVESESVEPQKPEPKEPGNDWNQLTSTRCRSPAS